MAGDGAVGLRVTHLPHCELAAVRSRATDLPMDEQCVQARMASSPRFRMDDG